MIFLLIGLNLMGFSGFAAVSHKTVKPSENWLHEKGVLRGGVANPRSSLREFRLLKAKNSLRERWVFETGDQALQAALGGDPSYYQVELREGGKQVVVHLGQTTLTKIEINELSARLKKSPNVVAVRIDRDKTNQAMNFIFDMRRPVKVWARGITRPNKPGRLFVDVAPMETGAKR
jgi:hypothetical protein